MRFAHSAALWFSFGNCAEFVQTMATRDYLRDQDAEEPEEFVVALTSQVFFQNLQWLYLIQHDVITCVNVIDIRESAVSSMYLLTRASDSSCCINRFGTQIGTGNLLHLRALPSFDQIKLTLFVSGPVRSKDSHFLPPSPGFRFKE